MMTLQKKILTGYIVLVAVMGCMAAILVHERQRMREIETKAVKIQETRLDINAAHRHITAFAMLGEGVVGWEDADYLHYRTQRLRTDSLLQSMKPHCKDFVRPAQIDTLRSLLEGKELHLRHIMEAIVGHEQADSLLANHLPSRRICYPPVMSIRICNPLYICRQ